jgi:hypothetical protein
LLQSTWLTAGTSFLIRHKEKITSSGCGGDELSFQGSKATSAHQCQFHILPNTP